MTAPLLAEQGAFFRNDMRWDDGKVLHACEGDRMVPFDHGTFLVWTLCQRDVPANAAFVKNGEAVTCQTCAARMSL